MSFSLLKLVGSASLLLMIGGFVGCSSESKPPFDLSQATYVGSSSCTQCHRNETQQHAGSHHALAMQVADENTVLGDFADARLEHLGIRNRMFRDGKNFMVETEGPDGKLQAFRVSYVFGLTPLQQYMVEFPAEGNKTSGQKTSGKAGTLELPRIQVLPVCWDTKNKKWFYLDPPDVKDKMDPHDDLHWTGIGQRWNNMCAECHSTNYQKNFQPAEFVSLASHRPDIVNQADSKIGTYKSTFSEINVACEACHGPASVHIELAKSSFPGWNRQRGYGLANLKLSAENQIQSCAPCHARRGLVFADFKAGDNYYDHYQENLLVWPIYYPDGQVLDEDYIHGSFLQSKMYHKGIRCTDCHDPHTAKLKHEGNQVCTSCHQHPTAKYDSPTHHFHKVGSEGASCVNCHMPATTYMEVDARHDHSLRLPRPGMSLAMGTPNACTGCHLKPENVAEEKRPRLKLYQHWMQAAREGDAEVAAEIKRADQWCNEACDKWYGEKRRRDEHWGMAIHAGQQRKPDAIERLTQLLKSRGDLAPAIARATALQVLADIDPKRAGDEALIHLADAHPLVRATAASVASGNASPTKAVSALENALRDPVRTVRLAAAQQLVQFPAEQRSSAARPYLQKALDEMRAGLAYSNDRAGSHLSLGTINEQLGMDSEAIKNYQTAIVVEPAMAGPRTNLAALITRNLDSATSLPEELRTKQEKQVQELRTEELSLLERDVKLLPNPPASLVYRYGLSLYLTGQEQLAVEQLIRAAEADTKDATYAETAALLLEKLQKWPDAIYWANENVKRSAGSPGARELLQRIQQQAK